MYANSYVLHHLLSWTCVFSSLGYSCAASYTQFENLASTTASFILDCFRIQTEMKFRSAVLTGPCTLRCSPTGSAVGRMSRMSWKPPRRASGTHGVWASSWRCSHCPSTSPFSFLCLEPCKTPTASLLRMTARVSAFVPWRQAKQQTNRSSA